MTLRVLVTGVNGFLGSHLLPVLAETHRVLSVSRNSSMLNLNEQAFISNIDGDTDWNNLLVGIDVVIHIAAQAHIKSNDVVDYAKTNIDGTHNLAQQAASAGVKRFIFISSIGVNGQTSNHPFLYCDKPSPHDAYSISKYHAEGVLQKVCSETNMEFVVIRPPLIYGSGAAGSFGSLMRLVNTAIPLPFGSVYNKRSFVYVGNVVDLIVNCVSNPRAKNQIFLVSDDRDISISDLISEMKFSAGRRAILIPVRKSFFYCLAVLFNKQSLVSSLYGDLQVDISHTKSTLDWVPPFSFEEGVRRCFN